MSRCWREGFALVGYASAPQETTEAGFSPVDASLFKDLVKNSGDGVSEDLPKEKSAWEFESYATGRQNVAFADIKISLKRQVLFGLPQVAWYIQYGSHSSRGFVIMRTALASLIDPSSFKRFGM
jgi:hypothetical protein